MATVADWQLWREKLFECRLKGIRKVRDQNGEEVEYKSDSEMDAAIRAADMAIAAAGKQPLATIIFRTSKGL